MRVISKKTLQSFIETHPNAKKPIAIWLEIVSKKEWDNPAQIKEVFGSADIIKNGRAVFNIGGNNFRIVCLMGYRTKRMFVKFVGTHAEYDKIDANTVNL